MTSLIGIKAYANPKAKRIIMASDTQLTDIDSNDVPVSKITGLTKISVGKNWAMSFTGTYTSFVTSFFRNLKSKGNSGLVEKAMLHKFFPEVQELTRKICRKYGQPHIVDFLLAVSKPELGLYFVDFAGNILEKPPEEESDDYLVLGSGEKYVRPFLEKKIGNWYIDKDGITIGAAVKVAYEAIKMNEDINTGGGLLNSP